MKREIINVCQINYPNIARLDFWTNVMKKKSSVDKSLKKLSANMKNNENIMSKYDSSL